MTKTYQKYRIRITILFVGIIFSWFSLCFRLFQVQVLNGHNYQKTVLKQSQKLKIIPGNRGNIFDRNKKPLTRNIIHYTISANPKKISNKIELSNTLSEITGKPAKLYLNKLNTKNSFIYLDRNLKENPYKDINPSNFNGLTIEKKYHRFYPHKQIGAQLIGYTDLDRIGISGIEKDYDKFLKSEQGWTYKTKGWSGKIQSKSGMPYQAPKNGSNVYITIDLEYQSILESELNRRVTETNALSATGLILNPQTGEILALATSPGFDNNEFFSSNAKNHRIRSITDQFEPGSTFKPFAAISGITNQIMEIYDEFNCENGEYIYYDIPIRDHEKEGILSLPQIIFKSSNVGIVKMAERIGSNNLYSTTRSFGFGSKTGISLNGESKGKLRPAKDWSAVSLGQIAMGHEVAVTALQLAMAYSAIANGGYLLKPLLVKTIMNQSNEIIYEEKSKIIRKVSSENTMKDLRKILRGVVSKGTGHNAEIKGWDIAGKTGTAQKFENGKYSDNQFISNFIGFFPYENPQVLVFVMLDEPEVPYHWGSEGAAVAFKRIATRIINMDDKIIPPAKKNKTLSNLEIKKRDEIAKINNQKRDLLDLSTQNILIDKMKVPDLKGLSLRKAMLTLNKRKLKFNINGSGKVIWQSPKPGSLVSIGSTISMGLN